MESGGWKRTKRKQYGDAKMTTGRFGLFVPSFISHSFTSYIQGA